MMLHHKLSSALLLCLAVLAVPCAFGEPPDLAVRVGKLEQSLSNQGLLDLSQELENLKREVKSLRGELENQTYALEQSKKAQTAVAADFDQRLRHLEGGAASAAGTVAPLPTLQAAPTDAVAGAPAAQGNLQVETNPEGATAIQEAIVDSAPSAAGAAATGTRAMAPHAADDSGSPQNPTAAPATAPADDAGSEAAYRDAFGLLKAGDYAQAITAFSAFQTQYPNSQYGDNAQFWLAEAHYVKRDFAAALPEYQILLDRYPASKKLSHAMLKIGYCYADMGKADDARTALGALKARFPDSAAAQLATQKLAHLQPGKP